jgi:hypothetical protein
LEFPAFESTKPRVACASRVGACPEAQSGRGPRLEMLAPQARGRVPCPSPAAIAWALAGCHRLSVVPGPARSVDRRSPANYRFVLREGAQGTLGRRSSVVRIARRNAGPVGALHPRWRTRSSVAWAVQGTGTR